MWLLIELGSVWSKMSKELSILNDMFATVVNDVQDVINQGRDLYVTLKEAVFSGSRSRRWLGQGQPITQMLLGLEWYPHVQQVQEPDLLQWDYMAEQISAEDQDMGPRKPDVQGQHKQPSEDANHLKIVCTRKNQCNSQMK